MHLPILLKNEDCNYFWTFQFVQLWIEKFRVKICFLYEGTYEPKFPYDQYSAPLLVADHSMIFWLSWGRSNNVLKRPRFWEFLVMPPQRSTRNLWVKFFSSNYSGMRLSISIVILTLEPIDKSLEECGNALLSCNFCESHKVFVKVGYNLVISPENCFQKGRSRSMEFRCVICFSTWKPLILLTATGLYQRTCRFLSSEFTDLCTEFYIYS